MWVFKGLFLYYLFLLTFDYSFCIKFELPPLLGWPIQENAEIEDCTSTNCNEDGKKPLG